MLKKIITLIKKLLNMDPKDYEKLSDTEKITYLEKSNTDLKKSNELLEEKNAQQLADLNTATKQIQDLKNELEKASSKKEEPKKEPNELASFKKKYEEEVVKRRKSGQEVSRLKSILKSFGEALIEKSK